MADKKLLQTKTPRPYHMFCVMKLKIEEGMMKGSYPRTPSKIPRMLTVPKQPAAILGAALFCADAPTTPIKMAKWKHNNVNALMTYQMIIVTALIPGRISREYPSRTSRDPRINSVVKIPTAGLNEDAILLGERNTLPVWTPVWQVRPN